MASFRGESFSADFKARERAVELIYALPLDPKSWPLALQAIADVTGDVGALFLFQRGDGLFGHVGSDSLKPMIDDFTHNYKGHDLRAMRAREIGAYFKTDVVTDLDVVTAQEMETHPFYRMLRRHNLKYFAGYPLLPAPDFVGAISVQRAADKPPFSAAEKEALMTICRHAENALRLSIRLDGAERVEHGVKQALDRLKVGIVALDSARRPRFLNDFAKSLLGDGLDIRNGRLTLDASDDAESALDAALTATAARLKRPRPIRVDRASAARPLAVYALPISGDDVWRDAFAQMQALLLIIDTETEQAADPATVRDLLGLTLGEARVASIIATGASPREAAQQLGLTEESARTILKRVYEKTGVSKQSRLAAILAKLIV